MATRFETKVIEVKNLTVSEVVEAFLDAYNNPATYVAAGNVDDQITISKSGTDLKIKFSEPKVLVPGISSFDEVIVEVEEIGKKQTYVKCSDIPGIRNIHLWIQYLPVPGEGSVKIRVVIELDIAWYNPIGKMIKLVIEEKKELIDNEISELVDQLEKELNEKFAPKKEEEVEAENA